MVLFVLFFAMASALLLLETFLRYLVTLSCLFWLKKIEHLKVVRVLWERGFLGRWSGWASFLRTAPLQACLSVFSAVQVRFSPERNLLVSCLGVYYPVCNQSGGKAGGYQCSLCNWSLIASVFSTLCTESSY